MKKIINGKKYDTDTAKELGYRSAGSGAGDFNHVTEKLYQKKTGEFFLYGEGGPMTSYAISVGTATWAGSEKITPLNPDEAKGWAERYLDADEYESIFGPVDE